MHSTKSVEAAGVLGIILGSVGAHDWYLGNKKGAWAHVGLLLLSVVLLIVGAIVLPLVNSSDTSMSNTLGIITMIILAGNAIWGALEGVLILVQGRAGLLQREEKIRNAAQKKSEKVQKQNAKTQQVQAQQMQAQQPVQQMQQAPQVQQAQQVQQVQQQTQQVRQN